MALLRIDQVVHKLYVHKATSEVYAIVGQDVTLKLEVVSVFDDFIV